jgi:hypothetical protein
MLRDDLIKGAREASRYSGLKIRSVYLLCGKGAIPVVRVGGRLYFRKSELDHTFTGMPLLDGKSAQPSEGQ